MTFFFRGFFVYFLLNKHTILNCKTNIYIYIYIYVCVCVCVRDKLASFVKVTFQFHHSIFSSSCYYTYYVWFQVRRSNLDSYCFNKIFVMLKNYISNNYYEWLIYKWEYTCLTFHIVCLYLYVFALDKCSLVWFICTCTTWHIKFLYVQDLMETSSEFIQYYECLYCIILFINK